MNCPRKDVEWFTRHAAGQLSAPETAAFDAHLRECAECRGAAEQYRTVWGALDEWPGVPVSDDFDRRLHARIAAADAEPWWTVPSMHISWRPAISVAAACAAVLIIFLLQGPFLATWTGTQTVQQKVDIDQVESALDDVDMLNQLGPAVPAKPPVHAQSGT